MDLMAVMLAKLEERATRRGLLAGYQSADENTGSSRLRYFYFVRVRASSRIRFPRAGLKTPQEQKRARYDTACSGVRRPSFTQSIIFFASDALTMP